MRRSAEMEAAETANPARMQSTVVFAGRIIARVFCESVDNKEQECQTKKFDKIGR
jgi:hypothetical protein